MNRARRAFTMAMFGVALLLAFSSVARAGNQATLEVMVLHATQTPGVGSIGPGIGNMPQLQQPPFSAWNTYRLLAKQSLTLQQNVPMTYALPNGRVLQITLTGVGPGPRFKIEAAINQPGGGQYLKLLQVTAPPNQTFFVAGQQYQGGVMIIGFTLR
jgi:hypothetical protein